MSVFPAQVIAGMQDSLVREWHVAQPVEVAGDDFESLVKEQHRCNHLLWHEEDEARRLDVTDQVIASVKRTIDRLNQRRNDFVERIDEHILSTIAPREDAVRHTETPGMIIDRLSILSLKIFHMLEQTGRADATQEHIQKCAARLAVLREQRQDLVEGLDDYLAALAAGTRTFKVYRQFKMYNDPTLNPKLYGRR
jgi:cell division protein FtsB